MPRNVIRVELVVKQLVLACALHRRSQQEVRQLSVAEVGGLVVWQ